MPRETMLFLIIGAMILLISLLIVSQPTPQLPEPDFHWIPSQPQTGQSTVFVPDIDDPHNLIVGYSWTLGDGTQSDRSSVQHQYNASGTYHVCLAIRDQRGRSRQTCKDIFVRARPQLPQAPIADFHWLPVQPEVGQSVQFVSDAKDPEGQLVSHSWDLGDGSRENLPAFTHSFSREGEYRVCLTVQDSQNLSSSICHDVKVARSKTRFFTSFISRDDNRQPTWSHDGKVIMFTSNRDGGNWELYTVNLATLVNTRITNNSALDFDPVWGKNGRVAFVSDRDNQTGTDIYILDFATGGVTRFTFDPGNLNQRPTWVFPTGHLVYHTDIDGNREIYRRDPQTGNANRLTQSPADDWNADVSPDGTKVAYQHLKDGRSQIFVMDIDGGRIRQITFNAGENVDPAWSPDSKRIAFASNRDGNYKIYVIDPETLSERLLTPDTFNSLHPAWSPDGTKIAFETDRTGNWEIWIMDTDGQNLKRITGVSR